jgi:lipoate-protein ligase B
MRVIKTIDLGYIDYREAYGIQRRFHQKRKNRLAPDTLILAEHPPVYTCGRTYKKEHIAEADKLKLLEIPIVKTDRGGSVTYHGPGQILIYPIFDLCLIKKDIHFYLNLLEESLIKFLALYQIKAHRKIGLPGGVWVEEKKIASIGIGISKWITYGGICLNVDVNLKYFKPIKPCGLNWNRMTSMAHQLKKPVDKKKLKADIVKSFEKTFGVRNQNLS